MPPDEKDKPLVWVLLVRMEKHDHGVGVWGVFTSAEKLLEAVNDVPGMKAEKQGNDFTVTGHGYWYEVEVCKTDTKW